jgi:hypothetical protein
MMQKFLAFLFVLFLCSAPSFAQSIPDEQIQVLKRTEDSLVAMSDSMMNAMIPDSREGYCEKFVRQLVRALKTTNSFSFPFEKLKTKINIITSEDNRFRIFNWYVLPDDIRPRYYGAIQMNNPKLKLIPLFDHTADLPKNYADSVLSNERWFGALYYRILENESEGEKIYTLFGLNATNIASNRKVLEPMKFTDKGVEFGASIFNIKGKGNIQRFVLEYKKDVQVSLNWDADMKTIFFDRLVSSVNDTNRKYTFVPSSQYDGFRWEKGKWNLVQDLIPAQNLKDGQAPTPKPMKKE